MGKINLREEYKKAIEGYETAQVQDIGIENRIVDLFKKWALEMVGEDKNISDIDSSDSKFWGDKYMEYINDKVSTIADTKGDIRQRIEEATK